MLTAKAMSRTLCFFLLFADDMVLFSKDPIRAPILVRYSCEFVHLCHIAAYMHCIAKQTYLELYTSLQDSHISDLFICYYMIVKAAEWL